MAGSGNGRRTGRPSSASSASSNALDRMWTSTTSKSSGASIAASALGAKTAAQPGPRSSSRPRCSACSGPRTGTPTAYSDRSTRSMWTPSVHRVSSTLNGPHATVCRWKANPAAGRWSRCMNWGRQASASSTPVEWTSENAVTVIGVVASRSRRHCRSLPTRCTRAPRAGSIHGIDVPAGLARRPSPIGVDDTRHGETRPDQKTRAARRRSINRMIIGVKISCMARSISTVDSDVTCTGERAVDELRRHELGRTRPSPVLPPHPRMRPPLRRRRLFDLHRPNWFDSLPSRPPPLRVHTTFRACSRT